MAEDAIISILWTIIVLEMSEGSEIVDGLDQKGIFISDYCPNIGSCPEGSHVMCMFYNPNSVMGPRCSNPQNISITLEIADKMLDIANAVRSKIALGKETGKDGNQLPKGFGLFRLKWDSELATFAQVLANQCVLRHDICRASKKFHDPGQAAGLVRFSNPHWRPVSPNVVFNTSGLTQPKVNYATTQSVKSWYSHKDHVTSDMIMNYPDWNKYGHSHYKRKKREVYRMTENRTIFRHPENLRGRLYMEMIFGSATHMGCGISAYSELAYHDNKADLTYNSIQTICNFSSRPKSGMPVYQTTQPTEPGFTVQCGCPKGYDEDEDCLCNEIPSPLETCGKKSCNPNVVLLPIFTVEDAPYNLLVFTQSQEEDKVIRKPIARNNTASMVVNAIDDIFSPYETYAVRSTRSPVKTPTLHYVQSRKGNNAVQVLNEPHYSRLSMNKITSNDYNRKREQRLGKNEMRSMAKQKVSDVKNRYFNKNVPRTSQQHQTQSLQMRYGHVQNRMPALRMRSSIFSRPNTFHLPSDLSSNSFTFRADIRRDVAPRKDFTKGKQVLDSYLTKKRNHEDLSNNELNVAIHPNVKRTINAQPGFKVTTIDLKPTKNFNLYLKDKFHYQDFNVSHQPTNGIDIPNSYEQADSKLMTLLDTLEQEVKHIELNGNKKELFDAKIKKIYDTVVHTSNLKSPLHARTEPDPEDAGYNNYVKSETDVTNHFTLDRMDDRRKSSMDDRIFKSENSFNEINSKLSDRFSDPKSLFLKKTKAHNSLLPYYENDKALSKHFVDSVTHDIYDTQIDDRNFANNNNRNEVLDKSMMRNGNQNKNVPYGVDSKLKHFKDIREQSDLKGRDNTNNSLRNTDKTHDFDDYSNINRNPFNDNELKPRIDDKNDDSRDDERRYDEEIKIRRTFRQPSFDLDDYRHTKKRSSDDKIKNRNQLRQFLGDKSLKSRHVYKKDGRIRHNYDEELVKRHNYDENLIELRRNENDMRRDSNEFRSRINDNEIRHKNYKDYGHDVRESHNDAIGLDRRKFYQSKLDNLERKLRNSPGTRRRSEREKERSTRLERTNRDDHHNRPSSKGQSQLYIPDRARILHGF